MPIYIAGCDVQVDSDEQSNLQSLFFQDKIMKEVFKAYPELIMWMPPTSY